MREERSHPIKDRRSTLTAIQSGNNSADMKIFLTVCCFLIIPAIYAVSQLPPQFFSIPDLLSAFLSLFIPIVLFREGLVMPVPLLA